ASFGRIEIDLASKIGPHLAAVAKRLGQRLDGLDHDVVALRERAHTLQEEMTLMVAEATNRHLHLLAVVTTLFLPPTLLTGVFGMNVKGLPLTEDDTGFLWAIGLLILASAAALWLL